MISKIIHIYGTSSEITFECENARIKADGEFLAKDGKIGGFWVYKDSLKYENGKKLTFSEQKELIRQYQEYKKLNNTESMFLEFD